MLNALAVILAVTLPPAPASRIYDDAGLLSPEASLTVQQGIQNVQSRTGITLGFVTFAQLDEDPQIVALRTINQWNLGQRSVVLLVSTSPRKIFLQPGPGLSSNFPRDVSENIARNVIAPRLRNGDFAGGVIEGFKAITTVAEKKTTAVTYPAVTPATKYEEGYSGFQIFGIFLLVAFGLLALGIIIRAIFRRNRSYGSYDSQYSGGGYTPGYYSSPPASSTNVFVGSNSSDGLVTGMLLNEALHHNHEPSRPAPSSTSLFSSTDDDNRRSSGGGSDWGSSSSGGGSDWGSSSSSGGGSDWGSSSGGGSDFGGGGGGGGSDW
jgi:uncharacterized protein